MSLAQYLRILFGSIGPQVGEIVEEIDGSVTVTVYARGEEGHLKFPRGWQPPQVPLMYPPKESYERATTR